MFIFPTRTIFILIPFMRLLNRSGTGGANPPGTLNSAQSMEQELLNTNYADLVRNNPYKDYNYNESFWQKALSALGFRTGADVYRENMDMQSREYLSAIAQKAHDEAYNDPSKEVDRLRAAGINPDISGGVDAGSAVQPAEDLNPPVASTGDMADVTQFANFVMSGVSAALGLAKDFKSLRILDNDVHSGEITNSKSIMDLAFDAMGIHTSKAFGDDVTHRGQLPGFVDEIVGSTLPKKYRKMFGRELRAALDSIPVRAKQYRSEKEMNQDRVEIAKMKGSSYYNDEDDALRAVVMPLVKLSDSISKKQLKLSDKKLDNEQIYQQTLDPSEVAKAENATNKNTTESVDFDREINSTMRSIVKDLSRQSKDGNFLASALLLIFSYLRINGMPSISYKSGNKYSGMTISN